MSLVLDEDPVTCSIRPPLVHTVPPSLPTRVTLPGRGTSRRTIHVLCTYTYTRKHVYEYSHPICPMLTQT